MTFTPWKNAPWEPRKWQREALPRALKAMESGNPVVRAVTGAGKSIFIAELCQSKQGRVLVTVPTVNLVDQTAATIRKRGIEVGKYYTKAKQHNRRVIVCCNDSLAQLAKRIDPPELWIADECHKTECDQIKDVILGARNLEGVRENPWMPELRVGMTATPYRADKNETLSLFDSLAYNYGPSEAMRDGVVVPFRVMHYQGTAKELDDACLEMIATSTGPGICDAININDAEHFATMLNNAGIPSKTVHSKLMDETVARRIKQLETGEIRCIVQVSMLSEGVDLPWLMWLCCRRPISSRTLFAQYVGRSIRTFPGKKYATIYDPQDLFGTLSIDYEAVLSGGENDDAIIPDLPALELDWAVEEVARDDDAMQETLRGVPVKVISPTVSYIRRLRLSMQSMGLIDMKMPDAAWRLDDPTGQQLNRINRDAWLVKEPDVPEAHSRALRIAIRAIEGCDRGTASDLISILNVLRYGWPEEEVAA